MSGRTPVRRLFNSILATEWAIHPLWMERFSSLAAKLEDQSPFSADEVRSEIRRALASINDERPKPEAVAFDRGELIREGSRATVRDGVAIVPVIGPLFHYADDIHDVCGCSSYAQITRDISAVRAAAATRRVRGVLLEVDSPGGEVGGCAETAALIADLARELPVTAYVADLGCSAGYWLTSAARRVSIASTARVGSIGVAAAYRRKTAQGDAWIEVVSSQSPKKRPDVETDSGRAQILSVLDALAAVFIENVAANRGTTPEQVMEEFGQGDVLVGENARAIGMADDIGSFERELELLASDAGRSRIGHRPAASLDARSTVEGEMPPENKAPQVTRAFLNEHHPDLVASILEEGRTEGRAAAAPEITAARTEGATAERTRVLGIQDLSGSAETRRACQNDQGCSVGDAALRLNRERAEADSRAAQGHLAGRAAAESEVEAPPPSSPAQASADQVVVHRILANARRLPKPAQA